jgi:hypothetical protein
VKLITILILIIATIISGYADSRGFIYSSQIWVNNSIDYVAVMKSGAGFMVGIFAYWIVIKSLQDLNVASSSEIQTLGWFVITIVGVAISSGDFIKWDSIDKLISLSIVGGFCLLLVRGH